jgi:hypothetical protein
MATEKEVADAFDHIASEVPGFIAASLVDMDSGMTLAVRSNRSDFDLAVASAYNIHFIKVVSPTVFIYLAAERASCNMAIVRTVVNKYAKAVQ